MQEAAPNEPAPTRGSHHRPPGGKGKRVCLLAAGIAALLLGLGLATVPRAWWTLNDVTTGATPEYPDVQPLESKRPPGEVFDAVRGVLAVRPRTRVVAADSAAGRIEAEATTRLFRFVDDLTVRVEPAGTGSRLLVRSRSRVGRGDLGQNARTIRDILHRVAEQLEPR